MGVYRYGFNGKENDNEVKGEGNQQDYGMRVYDPRLGRFLSVDPITAKYPELTPYQFASNIPIAATDLDGLEAKLSITSKITGYTLQHVYGDPVDGRSLMVVVPTYQLTLRDANNPKHVIGVFNVTRDAWYSIGTKDDQTHLVNRTFEPANGNVNLYTGDPVNYPHGTDLYAYKLTQYKISSINATTQDKQHSTMLDGQPIDAARKDPDYATSVMIHIGGVYLNGDQIRLGGSYGCFGFVPPNQIYKTAEEATQAFKKDTHMSKPPSNTLFKKFIDQVIKVRSKYDGTANAKVIIDVQKRENVKKDKFIDTKKQKSGGFLGLF